MLLCPACNGQDSVRIKVSEARVGQYIPDANMTHAPSPARTGFFQNIKMSEARVGQYTRCKYDACFKSCSDRILSELRCPRRASVSIPDANMTHAPSPARTGFCQNNIKMFEARVGQYTRCKYDACSKSCSDRIPSELRCPRRASVSIPDAKMTHAPSPARTGFCQN